ncbi:hypothetical protein [Paenibacillus sp. FSL H8-0537]|uniref:prenylated flavin chaperone LpdD n=1 Tax=Paenibacillus sp. FSL H8-0537 TaxID=2921399 RepID=UPI0031011F43
MEQQMEHKKELEQQVDIRVLPMGSDLVFLITGGAAHIGASATAYWTAWGAHLAAPKCDTITLPGHQEGELAAELAMLAASSLGVTATVVVGIHLEQPTRSEITNIVNRTREGMKQKIALLR